MRCIPPEGDAEFVAAMEALLEVYARPCDPARPAGGMDEQPEPPVSESRASVPASPGRPRRIDPEHAREGSCSGWLFVEPPGGWRSAEASPRRTAVDGAERVALMCDNLDTHRVASLDKAFPSQEARRIARRLEPVHGPKHGSWLNVAGPEPGALARMCLDRRTPDVEEGDREARARTRRRNARQVGVDGRFTAEDARIKLKWLYPKIIERDDPRGRRARTAPFAAGARPFGAGSQ